MNLTLDFKHIVIVILCATMALLSSCAMSSRIQKADKKYAIGEYYEAAQDYRKIYSKIPSKNKQLKGEIAFKQGECYRHINSPKAVQAYANAIRNKYFLQDSIVYLRQAQVLHYQGKYTDAIKGYDLYLQGQPDSYEAQAGRFACQQINEWKSNPTRYKISPAKEFNLKKYSSFSPCFIGETADALLFTSNRTVQKKKDKKNSPVTGVPICQLYSTRKDADGKWTEIEIAEGLNDGAEGEGNAEAGSSSVSLDGDDSSSDGGGSGNMGNAGGEGGAGQKAATSAEIGVCCTSADGRTLYFTWSKPINGQDLGAKIFSSARASGTWGAPQEVILFRDSTISVGHPALNHEGDTLYFASDAPGGFGGKDIWFSVLDGNKWSFPENMGPQINTSGDEMFPTVAPDGSLFFASNGHPGYGGLDIYHAIKDTMILRDSVWVQGYQLWNMGFPINSAGDDFGITFEQEGTAGFFSSDRGSRKAIDQIYRFVLPELVFLLEGTVTDPNGEAVTDAIIRLVGDNGTNVKLQTRRDGTYRIKLDPNVNYAMLASARGYLNNKEVLHTQGLKDSKTFIQNFTLTSLSKPVKMENVFYEFGKWTLTPTSAASLDALVKLLKDNPNITIELSAHTDLVGNAEANRILSEKRAQSCVDYLIKAGIQADRLTPVGYGKTKPVIADKALHNQYDFIPVDQELNEEFILSLPKNQQEICNQINRRTEFKVLRTTYGLY